MYPEYVILFFDDNGNIVNCTIAYSEEQAERIGKNWGEAYQIISIDYSIRGE